MKGTGKLFHRKTPRPADPEREAAAERKVRGLNRFSLLLHFAACFAGYFLIEAMARHSLRQAFVFLDERTPVFFYNVLILFVTTLPAYLVRKRAFYRVFAALFWLTLGIANGIILANRVTPLTGPDFGMIGDAFRVAGKYMSAFELGAVVVSLGIAAVFLVVFLFVSPKYKGKMRWKIYIPGITCAVLALAGLTRYGMEHKILTDYFSNIAYAYLDYGFPYSLAVTIFDTGISQPHGYSEELVQKVLDEEGELPETAAEDGGFPNIVVVQLESFFDPTRVKWLHFSEDPLPNWHALSEQYSSGLYTVSTVGAGTVNSEFETLTGMSLRFFGAGEYPYKGVLRKDTCESAAYVLSDLGYTSHVIHNNEAEFYGRNEVYPHLGFNSFTPGEYMNTQNDVNENGWMRDRCLLPYIGEALDSTENRDFVYVVTVQPHGAYPEDQVLYDPEITVSGAGSQGKKYAWEYYVSQIHEEDQFVADLIADLEARDEKTVVLFYGDHLPTMGLTDRDLRGRATVFDTDYLIWSNFDLERKERKVRAYQAVADLLGRIGIHEGVMFRYQQAMRNKGDYYYNMQILQYDLLYGERYACGMTNPWNETVLAMGEKPVRVDKIQKMSLGGVYYVLGQNFTQSCRFQVNGDLVDTTYLSDEKLLVDGLQLEKGDWVGVAVVSNSGDGTVLGTSNTLVYGSGRLAETDGAESG